MKKSVAAVVVCLLIGVPLSTCAQASPKQRVTGVSPASGGNGGNIKLTILGSGFSEDQFAYGKDNEAKGNKVTLVNDKSDSHDCPIHLDGSTERQITCFTPAKLEAETAYRVNVKVDNKTINHACGHCTFTPKTWQTSTIDSVKPQSGIPGEILLKLHGRFFTAIFGSTVQENTNGVTATILRVYSPMTCDLFRATDTFYYLALDSEDENEYYGTAQCKPEGTLVANINVSILIDTPFGQTLTDKDILRVAANGDIYTVQYYTNINSITPSEGSTEGGLVLTINGLYYETNGSQSTYKEATVFVGGIKCDIVSVTRDSDIKCTVPKQPSAAPAYYTGNRGAFVEFWDSAAFQDYAGVFAAPTSTDVVRVDESKHCGDFEGKWTRMTGIFVAPWDGSYIFWIKADDHAQLTVIDDAGQKKEATSTGHWVSMESLTLEKGKGYKLIAVGKQGSSNESCVEVKLHHLETKHTHDTVGSAVQEKQIFKLTSTTVDEQYSLKLSSFVMETPVHDKQLICLTGSQSKYKLGLHGVYTTEEDITHITKLKLALEKLAFLTDEETFTVATNTDDPDAQCIDITFNSDRGKIALFDTKPSTGIEVSRMTPGEPKNLMLAFEYNGVPSPLLEYDSNATAFATKIEEALKIMFGVRCQEPFTNSGNLAGDFEGGPSVLGEKVTSEVPAFCGRYSVKDNGKVFPILGRSATDVNLALSPWMCFAARGLDNTRIKLKYKNKDDAYKTFWENLDFLNDGDWNYTCKNVRKAFDDNTEDPIGTYKLVEAAVDNTNRNTDYYIDNIYFGFTSILQTFITIDDLRLGPAYPNVIVPTTMEDISVIYNDTTEEFMVTLIPHDCGYDFKLLTLAYSEITEGSDDLSSSSVSSTLIDGSATLAVTRIDTSSKPLKGSVIINYNGIASEDIDVQISDDLIKSALEAIDGIGTLTVARTDESTCANMDIIVEFTTKPGVQELMTVPSTENLIWPSTADAFIVALTKGHIELSPIPGDMFFTYHTAPQITVFINEIPTVCSMADNNCQFTWSTAATPTTTAIDITEGNQNDQLTITGTLFSETASENTVSIGGIECNVVSSTSTQIVCIVGNGHLAKYPVIVTVDGKGNASGTVEFTYSADLTSISPTQSSLGGHIKLTVSGTGLSENSVIMVGSNECKKISTNIPDNIYCMVPAHSDLSATTEQDVDVTVSTGTVVMTTTKTFKYVVISAKITSVTTVGDLTVHGDQPVTITGTDMGAVSVYIDGGKLIVESNSDTEIIARTPKSIPAGTGQSLFVNGEYGVYLNQAKVIPTVDIVLEVTNVYPTRGSLYGGTPLTITGTGFGGDMDEVTVSVGEYSCVIMTVKDTEIKCRIQNTTKVHYINNEGTTGYGPFFAFSKTLTYIKRCDKILFTWKTPEFVFNVFHGVYERAGSTTTENKPNGVSSGPKSRDGQHLQTFCEIRRYNLWSGFTDTAERYYSTAAYVSDRADSKQSISVLVAGQEAFYKINTGQTDPTDASGCTLMSDDIADCVSDTVPDPDSSKFTFFLTKCHTPIVTDVSFNAVSTVPRSALSTTEITIVGTSFSSDDCSNEAMIGGCACNVSESSSTTFKCIQDTSKCQYTVGEYKEFSMIVNQYGYAPVVIDSLPNRSMGFLPLIQAVTPSSGSSRGGTTVTISGTGFTDIDNVVVEFNSYAADCSGVNPIVCTTPELSNPPRRVEITASMDRIPAVCETKTACIFSYDSASTPVIKQVSPEDVSGEETLTLTGMRFGSDKNKLSVAVGGQVCVVTEIVTPDTEVACTVSALPAGSNAIELIVENIGKAISEVSVTGLTEASLDIDTGSVNGYTLLTFTGHGFVDSISITAEDSDICKEIDVISLTEVTCLTVPHIAATISLQIVSNGETYNTISFEFSDSVSPVVSSINPVVGNAGTSVTITGEMFGTVTNDVSVFIGDAECTVSNVAETEITCATGHESSGSHAIIVYIAGKGRSTSAVTFKYEITIESINPTFGDELGNQFLTLSGSGFSVSMKALVCGKVCVLSGNVPSPSEYTCITPPGSGTCAVTVEGTTVTGVEYTYTEGVAPYVARVNPSRGGTGGNTAVIITGTRFSATTLDVTVHIDDVDCVVSTSTTTEIRCNTGAHTGSILANMTVTINEIRATSSADVLKFYYVDVWSSGATWNQVRPEEGSLVEIPKGQVVLLDEDTPVLGMLLIGGLLIYDDTKPSITLNSQRILIIDGGILQIGTETKPYPNKAVIKMYGHTNTNELPIYGTKVLGVRNGTLELHGLPSDNTWTRLAYTAESGTNTLIVQDSLNGWLVGDELVVATTGAPGSVIENEQHTITAIEGKTITLKNSLSYTHLGTFEEYVGPDSVGNVTVNYRAEVGRLTRNIVILGDSEPKWEQNIPACKAGFNAGEFATQTCFEGRFGETKGSSQFGAHIIIHQTVKDTQDVVAHISNVEVTFAGQAFRLGRYPIHFHLNGNMNKSYVKGCSIHHTFNRAINIHGSHNTFIGNNVAYDVMGGAYFLEDGIETGVTFDHNLGIGVKSSTSLLNDDITPAAFWITNPDNILINNAAAGGTHFGFWYRMHEHPDGPSYDKSICPRRVPVKRFQHNSAHSCGWFGFWMFAEYMPAVDSSCTGSSGPAPAVIEDFLAWFNTKGMEWVDFGSMQAKNNILSSNVIAGFEGKRVIGAVPYDYALSAFINDTLIIGKANSPALQHSPNATPAGIIMPFGSGMQVHNTKFINFKDNGTTAFKWTKIDGICIAPCGGYNSQVSKLQFQEVTSRVQFRFGHEAVLHDLDGSLCETNTPIKLLPDWGESIPTECQNTCSKYVSGVAGAVCPSTTVFHRFAFNQITPKSLEGKELTIENEYGISTVPYAFKRLTHKSGWMGIFVDGQTYKLDWVNAENMTNVTFTGLFSDFSDGDCMIIETNVADIPSSAAIISGISPKSVTKTKFSCADPGITSGDWYYSAGRVGIAIVGGVTVEDNERSTTQSYDMPVSVNIFKCFFADCKDPKNPETDPPEEERPNLFQWWSADIWEEENTKKLATKTGEGSQPSNDGTDVHIEAEMWVVIMEHGVPKLGTVVIEGTLEIDFSTLYDYTFRAHNIIIIGGRFIVGWPNNPVLGTVNIILLGNKNYPPNTDYYGYDFNKAVGVFGGLDLNGIGVGVSWTRLKMTAHAGDETLTVVSGSDIAKWKNDDHIIITSTSYSRSETEEVVIKEIDTTNGIITLSSALGFRHNAGTETVDGRVIDLSAAVGLLTRSIVVQGEPFEDEYYGGRILASIMAVDGNARTGFVRASNVQFKHMGQDGYTEHYDPRFALSFVETGTVTDIKPSNITGCSFDDLYNSAFGAFGTRYMPFTNNIVYKPLGTGIRATSDDMTVDGNLVANVQWTGSYGGRSEPFNFRFDSGFDMTGTSNAVVTNNFVAASERVGYRVPCENCNSVSKYSNNMAAGNLMGVSILPDDDLSSSDIMSCCRLSGFTVSKNLDYGIYYNNIWSFEASNNAYADENNALFSMVIGPNPLGHECSNKTVTVKDSVVIGTSSVSDCSSDISPTGVYLDLSSIQRSGRGPNNERLGVLFPQFTGGSNGCPHKPCGGIMSYNTICGKMTITGTTFKNFAGATSGCSAAVAIATSPSNDDLQHPVLAIRNAIENVLNPYKVLIHRPNLGKVNPADCVDMDCDAFKKALFKDEDGTIMDEAGSIIPVSEWEWGGDLQRGLSDARVPKDALTTVDGDVQTVNQIAMNGKGIIRTDSCTKQSGIKGVSHYWCPGLQYEMMWFESLDDDTELRRLSPVAVLSDFYIDLINGPQDHGWCNGYTCQKRVSVFHILVLPGQYITRKVYIYLSSTQPDDMRFGMLNAAADKCVLIVFYYLNPNRIDVYINGGRNPVFPINSEVDENGNFRLLSVKSTDEYIPTCADPHGSNFIDRNAHQLYIILKGSTDTLTMKRSQVIIVAFDIPGMSEAEVFGSNIVFNLASLLDIPLNKIIIVQIVAESGSRKRRSTGVTIILEIGDQLSDTSDSISGSLEAAAAAVMNDCLNGQIASALGTTGATCNEIIYQETYYAPIPAEGIPLYDIVSPSHEGVPFAVQPKIRAYDTNGDVIDNLGIVESPWEITATLRSCDPACGHASAVLSGTLTVAAISGWFNFTDLQISHKGDGYVIDFNITYPAGMNLTVATQPFSVDGVPMTAGIYSMTSGEIPQDSTFALTLDLRDSTTDAVIPDITWRGHTSFDITCGLVVASSTGNLTGTLSQTFDSATGRASFSDLVFSGYGQIYLSCLVESTPAEFEFYSFQQMFVLGSHQVSIPSDASEFIAVRYAMDYTTTLPTVAAAKQLEMATVQTFTLKYPGVKVKDSDIKEGSIVVTFTIEGSTMNVSTTLQTICSEISSGTEVTIGSTTLTLDTYITVDGTDYYATCTSDDDGSLHPAYIALIVILCVLLIAVVIFFLVWRFNIKPKSKTHEMRRFTVTEYADNGRTVFLAGPNQKVNDIFYKQATEGLRPRSSAPITTLYDETLGPHGIRKSPLPPDMCEGARAMTPTGL